jgi:hypothetical protein
MKHFIIFFLSFFCVSIYASGYVTVKHTTGNVTVYVSCFSYREEINKGFIIGEYARELSKINNYNDSIEIYLEMTPSDTPEYLFRDKKNIFLHAKSLEFNLADNLKLIEYAISKRGKFGKNTAYNKILKADNSSQINTLLKLRINRPNVVKDLENKSDYSYYYQGDKYYIYDKKTNKIWLDTKSIYLFSTIAIFRPLIFTNNHEFYYKNLNGDLKFNSFSNGNKLHENSLIKEFNIFVVFDVFDKKIDGNNVSILNITTNKLIDNLTW